ncbi:unnamed protein product [Brassica oleracea]|uniref:(rape) hypothetical protein n=1 Tax=Brassica napus TaxID=3708 RepID=A0A816J3G7_BRANA|nr:unnamed protein product [Brassica napus]
MELGEKQRRQEAWAGLYIKSRDGEVICRGSSNRTHVGSALMAEALAVRDALRKANELNLQSLQIFSDS